MFHLLKITGGANAFTILYYTYYYPKLSYQWSRLSFNFWAITNPDFDFSADVFWIHFCYAIHGRSALSCCLWSWIDIFHLVKKPLVLVNNDPKRLYGWENLPFSSIFSPFWDLFNASGIHIGFKIGSYVAKWSLERGNQLTWSSIW